MHRDIVVAWHDNFGRLGPARISIVLAWKTHDDLAVAIMAVLVCRYLLVWFLSLSCRLAEAVDCCKCSVFWERNVAG